MTSGPDPERSDTEAFAQRLEFAERCIQRKRSVRRNAQKTIGFTMIGGSSDFEGSLSIDVVIAGRYHEIGRTYLRRGEELSNPRLGRVVLGSRAAVRHIAGDTNC